MPGFERVGKIFIQDNDDVAIAFVSIIIHGLQVDTEKRMQAKPGLQITRVSQTRLQKY